MSERKVALVIDGMSGLGTAICHRLQSNGLTVMASYPVHQRHPEAWLAAQRDEGYALSAWPADVAAPDDCAALVNKVLAAYGKLDVLVHLAAAPAEGAVPVCLGELSPADWRAALRTVTGGAFNLNKCALPPMLERQWGRIIQVAAAPAWPAPGRRLAASHAAANAALHGLARALALETARHGVTVNTIMPGYLRQNDGIAPQSDARTAEVDEALIAAHVPVGRLGSVAEVAALVAYLASDSAAFVTGAQIAINGGQHMY
jgi:acetoacetyl-CoA reductase